jgi:hypothetical protein
MENLLEKKVGYNKGAGVVGLVVGLVVGIVLVVGVALPVATNIIDSANITDPTTQTIVNIIPVMVAIIPIVLIAQTF